MPQFTVYKNKNPATKAAYPYLLDVQANLLDSLQTRMIAPLIKVNALQKKSLQHVTPIVTFDGDKYLVLMPQLAGLPATALGPRVGELGQYRDDLIAALDFLFVGI